MITIDKKSFGRLSDGREVHLYTLKNQNRMEVDILDFGGTIVSIRIPNRPGEPTDVVLGYDNVAGYETGEGYLGALIGRHGNRIRRARFVLNGVEYPLYANDGANHLHGGKCGFDHKIWEASVKDGSLFLHYLSRDGEEGYPGNLDVTVVYTLDDDNALTIDYQATTDADTVCNLTNHTYFNLSGYESGPVLDQKIRLVSERFTPADAESLPDGRIAPVEGTPMDLRSLTPIGAHIDDGFEQLRFAGGYDHNWIIDGEPGTLRLMAQACSDQSGITLEAYATNPSVQFYTGNFLKDHTPGKGGHTFSKRWGFCLESQFYPNSLEHPEFPQPVLKQGERYHQVTVFRFGWKK